MCCGGDYENGNVTESESENSNGRLCRGCCRCGGGCGGGCGGCGENDESVDVIYANEKNASDLHLLRMSMVAEAVGGAADSAAGSYSGGFDAGSGA